MKLNASIEWQQDLAFKAALDGHEFTIDGAPQAGGRDLGPSPKGLTLVSLIGCTGMDVISILGKMRVPVETFRVEAEARLADEHPKKYLEVKVTFKLTGSGIDLGQVRKAIALSEDKYCGVSATLSPVVALSHEIVLNNEKVPN